MEDLKTLTTQEQARAVLPPLRQQILQQLKSGPATPSDVARAIGIAPNKAHFHVRTLVRLVETRTTGIVTEHFFARTARQFEVDLRDGEGKVDLAGADIFLLPGAVVAFAGPRGVVLPTLQGTAKSAT